MTHSKTVKVYHGQADRMISYEPHKTMPRNKEGLPDTMYYYPYTTAEQFLRLHQPMINVATDKRASEVNALTQGSDSGTLIELEVPRSAIRSSYPMGYGKAYVVDTSKLSTSSIKNAQKVYRK